MKTSALCLLALLAAAPLLRAQNDGAIRATTKLRPDGSTSTTVLDPEKGTAEETLTNSAGVVQRRTLFQMGDSKFAYGATFFDGKGNVLYKAGYKRDEMGRVLESSFTSKEGRYLGKRVFQYGSGDQATQVDDYDAAGKLIPPKAPKPAGPGIPDKKKR